MSPRRDPHAVPRRVRGLNGCWKTYDREPGAVRDMNGRDSRAKAAVDGGGLLAWGTPADLVEQPAPPRRARRRGRRAA